ncbi:hypothetical protein PHMEG_0009597 [Phytophthora megakarya]|uniref:Uncharacterized protein n=1 Tax=Phytophthora megakarya TaxID=4795 RepID=A0A225WIA0_9STRA|nr:hypothetical protein PHMEG_0009597 [Phytophthora megakarya]
MVFHSFQLKLRTIANKHDIRRIELGNDPPVKVKYMKIRLKEGTRHVKCKPRHYPSAVLSLLCGWVYETHNSRRPCAVISVRKPGGNSDEFRQTTDDRVVNDLIDVMIATIPHMATLIKHTLAKKYVGLLDLLKSFWQPPLETSSAKN